MADVERREQMFPSLSAEQVARLLPFGRRQQLQQGAIVFDQGTTSPEFFVLLSGSMEIVQPADGKELPITVHHAGEFTGEVNMLSGRRSLVRGRMAEPGELLVITPEGLRKIVQTDAELSE